MKEGSCGWRKDDTFIGCGFGLLILDKVGCIVNTSQLSFFLLFFSASFSPSFSRALGASDAKDSGFITEIVGLVGVV